MSMQKTASPSSIIPPDGGYGWVVVVVCFCNYTTILILSTSFAVLYKEYMDAFDADVVVVAAIAAYQAIAVHLAGFLSSSLFHHLDVRVVAMCGAMLASLSCFLASFSINITMLAVCYTVSGAGFGVVFVTISPVVLQYFTKKSTLVTGITIAGFSVGAFVFPPCTRYAVDILGWRGTLALYAGISMQNVWLCALHRPLIKPQKLQPRSHLQCHKKCWLGFKDLVPVHLLKNPSYALFSLTSFTVNVNFSVYTFHIVNKCLSEGIDKYWASSVPSVGGLTNAILGPLFGIVASLPVLRRHKVLLYSVTATGLGVFMVLLGAATTYATIVVTVGFLSLSVASNATMQHPTLVDIVGIEHLPRGVGLLMMFSGIGQFVGSPLAGYLYQVNGSYALPYFVTGSVGIVGGLATLLIIPLSRR